MRSAQNWTNAKGAVGKAHSQFVSLFRGPAKQHTFPNTGLEANRKNLTCGTGKGQTTLKQGNRVGTSVVFSAF